MSQIRTARFAVRLRELREKAGLTQQQLGERAGVHKLTVAKLEQGIRGPTWATALALADALGVNCLALATVEESAGPFEPRPRGRPPKQKAPEEHPKRSRGGTRK